MWRREWRLRGRELGGRRLGEVRRRLCRKELLVAIIQSRQNNYQPFTTFNRRSDLPLTLNNSRSRNKHRNRPFCNKFGQQCFFGTRPVGIMRSNLDQSRRHIGRSYRLRLTCLLSDHNRVFHNSLLFNCLTHSPHSDALHQSSQKPPRSFRALPILIDNHSISLRSHSHAQLQRHTRLSRTLSLNGSTHHSHHSRHPFQILLPTFRTSLINQNNLNRYRSNRTKSAQTNTRRGSNRKIQLLSFILSLNCMHLSFRSHSHFHKIPLCLKPSHTFSIQTTSDLLHFPYRRPNLHQTLSPPHPSVLHPWPLSFHTLLFNQHVSNSQFCHIERIRDRPNDVKLIERR
ncbi:hypothetical protein BLNAU_4749 [Blattamonas nauphoetae]|uniref:Uncharacterized protein n=1 Tax=Blattamonas nauphoetae TaxID=2049346 RepID=A0ABQ9Y8W9_9EUKA|nr:hypothetical protein BLNAU_4749 [Blattamonas nauphoetae]